MARRIGAFWIASALAALLAAPAAAETPTPEEAQRRWLHRLDGQHFTATLRQRVERGARRLTVRRDDVDGAERLLLRQEQPSAISGRSWLLREQPGGPPLMHFYESRDRTVEPHAIPALRSRNPLMGADPHLMGLRAAWPAPVPESIQETRLEDAPALLLVERGGEGAPYELRRTWIDPATWVALKLEHERGGEIVLAGEVEELREIQGVPTPMRVRFDAPNGEVIYRYETMDYRRAIRPSYFELPR